MRTEELILREKRRGAYRKASNRGVFEEFPGVEDLEFHELVEQLDRRVVEIEDKVFVEDGIGVGLVHSCLLSLRCGGDHFHHWVNFASLFVFQVQP